MFDSRPNPPAKHAVGDETRQQLIDAATRVFLAEGFRAARVKDIADAAGVRLSAINYHFKGKEGLYLAVLEHHARLAMAHSPTPAMSPDLPLQTRFNAFVRALVLRMLDPASPSRISGLMVREAASPTPALQVMFEHFTKPQSAILFGMLREILGPAADDTQVARCGLSIVGQSMVYVGMRPLVELLRPGFYQQAGAVAALADHIAAFSWAGLQALAASNHGTKDHAD
ncbi:CerR family C-terminal domain-containing protein [Chitinimonas sp.]|uniref:CerR family C-terminal domain-containing protein n=1 Tax=Chitinimonas sp. TaxID=1934313 RepID=UPI002F932E00